MDFITLNFMDHFYLLGVKLHKIKKKEILKKIEEWLEGDKFNYITTVNPEFILEAQKNEEFKKILNDADLSIPDGIGLKFAAWIFGRNIYRVAGADLTKDILKLAEQKSCSLYFFVWKDGLSSAEDVKDSLKHPPNPPQGGNLIIDGQVIERDGSDIDWDKFNNFAPDILFVGLGAPYQEKLIEKIKNRETSPIKVAIGVGGTFDFLTGKIKRAPKIMQIIGLEWAWRLIQQPKKSRIKRIFNAVIVFPYEVLKWRMKMFFCYRRNVIGVIINKDKKILLCERADEKGHWQFVQGGVDNGEQEKDAVRREIYEETNIKDIEIIGSLEKKYRYSWKGKSKNARLKYGYRGQIQKIFLTRFLGGDNQIDLSKEFFFVNYQWVDKKELLEKLHPVRKKVGVMVLKELEKIT